MGYLDEFPLLLIFVTSLIIILLASEIGRRLGVRARGRGEERVATLEGAMFGLLALMLGFTFAMALSRFEERRANNHLSAYSNFDGAQGRRCQVE
jgi:hypothetical protein